MTEISASDDGDRDLVRVWHAPRLIELRSEFATKNTPGINGDGTAVQTLIS